MSYPLHRAVQVRGVSLQLLTFLCIISGINLSGEERYMEHNHVEDRRLNSDIVFEELDIGRASQCFGYLILMSHPCFIKT
jgi:hypothetical protein